MMEVLMAINPDISDEEYSTAVDDVLDFETAIANVRSTYCIASMGYPRLRNS